MLNGAVGSVTSSPGTYRAAVFSLWRYAIDWSEDGMLLELSNTDQRQVISDTGLCAH